MGWAMEWNNGTSHVVTSILLAFVVLNYVRIDFVKVYYWLGFGS